MVYRQSRIPTKFPIYSNGFHGFSGLNTLYGNGQGTNCCNGHPGPSPITARLVGLTLRNPLILLALDKGNALSLSEAPVTPKLTEGESVARLIHNSHVYHKLC